MRWVPPGEVRDLYEDGRVETLTSRSHVNHPAAQHNTLQSNTEQRTDLARASRSMKGGGNCRLDSRVYRHCTPVQLSAA